jgi:hypothetical protein
MDLPKIIGIIAMFLALASFVYALVTDPWDPNVKRKQLLVSSALIAFFGTIFGVCVGVDCASIAAGLTCSGIFILLAFIILLVRRNIEPIIY